MYNNIYPFLQSLNEDYFFFRETGLLCFSDDPDNTFLNQIITSFEKNSGNLFVTMVLIPLYIEKHVFL